MRRRGARVLAALVSARMHRRHVQRRHVVVRQVVGPLHRRVHDLGNQTHTHTHTERETHTHTDTERERERETPTDTHIKTKPAVGAILRFVLISIARWNMEARREDEREGRGRDVYCGCGIVRSCSPPVPRAGRHAGTNLASFKPRFGDA